MSERESHCTPGRPVPDIPAANDSAPGNETVSFGSSSLCL